ncbi:hypothetical protein SCG7109_AB_00580 [Chlamydiales bacterium SCGC AG-110-M15]|nr:hypothetical protein SCG7109_AB_00580 [Chlamydiales bacterium SCGC AG-110-M15]
MKKSTLAILTIVAILIGSQAFGQMGKLYELTSSPYVPNIASKPGDILTVIVSETSQANETGSRELTREDSKKFNLKEFFLPYFKINNGFDDTKSTGDTPVVEFETADEFEADSTNASQHSFETRFQVRIVEQVGEDQLVIRGQRLLNLNGKRKNIFVSGVIRRDDISSSFDSDPSKNFFNTIRSELIADAVIEVEGETFTKDLEPGVVSKVLSYIFF